MSVWPATKARKVRAALGRIGWSERLPRNSGSHQTLLREGWLPYTWAFDDGDELGPVMLSKIGKTGLEPSDL